MSSRSKWESPERRRFDESEDRRARGAPDKDDWRSARRDYKEGERTETRRFREKDDKSRDFDVLIKDLERPVRSGSNRSGSNVPIR